jgi:hypothetical protein
MTMTLASGNGFSANRLDGDIRLSAPNQAKHGDAARHMRIAKDFAPDSAQPDLHLPATPAANRHAMSSLK